MEIALLRMVRFGKIREIKTNISKDIWARIPFTLGVGKHIIFGKS